MTVGATTSDLLLIGASGFARETASAVIASNAVKPRWNLLGVLDDDPARQETLVGGMRVLGPIAYARNHPTASIVVCTGRPDAYMSRPAIVSRLDLPDEQFATIVHPMATVGLGCELG